MTTSASASPACTLCGLRLPARPRAARFGGTEAAFCCAGCLNVYTILSESGLIAEGVDVRDTELFKRSLALGLIARPDARPPERLDTTDTRELVLRIGGMWCASCGWLIEHALSRVPGVVSAEVFFSSDLAKVTYCPQYVPVARIKSRIESLGYEARDPADAQDRSDDEMRDLLLRTGIAGFLWLNIMTLSVVLYVGYFEHISESFRRGIPFVLMALATPVVFYSAYPILRLGWRGVATRAVGMETLLGIGILAAYLYSAIQAFTGAVHIYFDTASAIVTLVLIGKIVERDARQRTTRALGTLFGLVPAKARLLVDGTERFVSAERLCEGDVFVVKDGERIPADGLVVDGVSHADESLLTGESRPVFKEPGSRVVAGSVNTGGILRVCAEHVGEETAVANIIRLVQNALRTRSALERTVDRVARAFVPAVIAIALLTAVAVWMSGGASSGDAVMRAITVLVIACPCALGMATPLAITTAVGAAARKGVIVSDVGVLETITGVDVVLFDKTGTITNGDFSLRAIALAPCESRIAAPTAVDAAGVRIAAPVDEIARRRAWLGLMAALERYSEHPLGRELVRAADDEGVELRDAHDVEVINGMGIVGRVGSQRVFVGNGRLAASRGADACDVLARTANAWECEGLTTCYFGSDSMVEGVAAFGDRLRPEAREVVSRLQHLGVRVVVVSGDSATTTGLVAEAIGADGYVADATPASKVTVLEDERAGGSTVAFVGDGVNDAPVLASADLGIAMGSGADVAASAASLVIMQPSLDRVLTAFEIARRTRRVVRQNLFWAFVYNAAGISLAVAGLLTPILAACAMLLSSVSVVANSRRLARW